MTLEPFQITRTRTRRYVGICGWNGCPEITLVARTRLRARELLQIHTQQAHGFTYTDNTYEPTNANTDGKRPVKTPGKELPPQEKFTDYADHLFVFNGGKSDTMDTKFEKDSPCVKCLVYVLLDTGTWKNLGETPVFQKTLMHRIMEDGGGGPIGGRLTKGTDRNPNEWDLVAATSAKDRKALEEWEKNHDDDF
jgi:hypothetical protein